MSAFRSAAAASLLASSLAGPALAQAVRLPAGACPWQTTPAAWGAAVRSFSTQFNSTGWAATSVLGPPNVFPAYGDRTGAWAPGSTSNQSDFVEVLFGTPTMASEIWVFETNGTGGLYGVSAINADGSMTTLVSAQPARLQAVASQLVVPVEPARMLAGVRLDVSSASVGTYAEIDAVAAVSSPTCRGGAVASRPGTTVRLSPAMWMSRQMPPAVAWASGVQSFSTQYDNSGWAAVQALGPANVFPRHGDIQGTWAPSGSSNTEDAIVLQFAPTVTRRIWVFETYGVGGLWILQDVSGGAPVTLYAATAGPASPSEARVLEITLQEPRLISALRLVTASAAVSQFAEIDAVALVP